MSSLHSQTFNSIKLHSIILMPQFLCSQAHILAGWSLETRLTSAIFFVLFITPWHGSHRKHNSSTAAWIGLCGNVLTQLLERLLPYCCVRALPSNGCFSGSIVLALSKYATIYCICWFLPWKFPLELQSYTLGSNNKNEVDIRMMATYTSFHFVHYVSQNYVGF
jgi:hypothetical protein